MYHGVAFSIIKGNLVLFFYRVKWTKAQTLVSFLFPNFLDTEKGQINQRSYQFCRRFVFSVGRHRIDFDYFAVYYCVLLFVFFRRSSAFVRGCPARGVLGGISRYTHEVVLLCQVAGYDPVIVETVGLGQSEVWDL